MINIKQLRLGNYVMYEQTTHVVTGLQGGMVWSRWINGTEPYICSPEALDPIPLTEEVLLKCGLTQKGSLFGIGFLDTIYWYNIENQILYIEYTDSPFSEDEGVRYPVSSPIKHLHVLMNIIYDLTGRGLEVKL